MSSPQRDMDPQFQFEEDELDFELELEGEALEDLSDTDAEDPGHPNEKDTAESVMKFLVKTQERSIYPSIPPQVNQAFGKLISTRMLYCINSFLEVFRYHPNADLAVMPSSLSTFERNYARLVGQRFGINSDLNGTPTRARLSMTMRKAGKDEPFRSLATLNLSPISQQCVKALCEAFPFRSAAAQRRSATQERQGPRYTRGNQYDENLSAASFKNSGSRLPVIPFPKVPPARLTESFATHRANLPIMPYRSHILRSMNLNQITLISGNTGSGKTTQVPQYILDDALETGYPVRIICTVPQRIEAIAACDRVAEERGEVVGHTVGFQVRLESRVSPCDTLLTYCTSGVLLRSLTAPDYSILSKTTHIVLDEVQVRDCSTDFLFTLLRDLVPVIAPHLRIILMGSDLDTQFWKGFFERGGPLGPLAIVNIESTLPDATSCYIHSIKEILNLEPGTTSSEGGAGTLQLPRKSDLFWVLPEVADIDNATAVGEAKQKEVDRLIATALFTGEESVLFKFVDLVLTQQLGIDSVHSVSGVTMLMAFSMRGMEGPVLCLLNLGANWSKETKSGLNAEGLSQLFFQESLTFLLECFRKAYNGSPFPLALQQNPSMLSTVDQEQRADLPLIYALLHYLHVKQAEAEAILVLLPSYDDIFSLKEMIFGSGHLSFDSKSFVLHLLHNCIQSGEQRVIFAGSKPGVRKIILATPVFETLTIDDVAHVIDSGKIQELTYGSNYVPTLTTAWINKGTARARVQCTGNHAPALVFRCYTKLQHENMLSAGKPEMVKTDLSELCLHARATLWEKHPISRFFQRLPSPPQSLAVKRAVESLQRIGALNKKEQLTHLGTHLLDFNIEPRYAKALIFAVILRCLDPVLTIIAAISHRDPFFIPNELEEQQNAFDCRRQLSVHSFSDHMSILKAFQEWEAAKTGGHEDSFCTENYIVPGTFDMIYAIRTELLGQLRASGFVRCKGVGDIKSLNYNANNWSVVKGILVSALYPNIMKLDRTIMSLSNDVVRNARFHPSSCIQSNATTEALPSDWILYDEISQHGTLSLVKGCTLVSAAAVAMFGGNLTVESAASRFGVKRSGGRLRLGPNEEMSFKLDKWVEFTGRKDDIKTVLDLRVKFRELVHRQLLKPGTLLSQGEETTMHSIVLFLTSEDKAAGLLQVDGVGQWPRFAGGNLLSAPRFGYEKTGSGTEFSGAGLELDYSTEDVLGWRD